MKEDGPQGRGYNLSIARPQAQSWKSLRYERFFFRMEMKD
jgi:hypothetical protein